MKITLALPFVNLTGGIRLLLDYANWLHDDGHVVTVVYPLWPYRFNLRRKDQWSEFRKQIRTSPDVTWLHLRAALVRVPFIADIFLPPADLVVATSWPVAHSVARLDASRGRKVHIVFHHESGTGPEARIRSTYSLPFHRLAFSTAVRDFMKQQFFCEIHQVLPASIDTARFFPDGKQVNGTVLMLYHNDPRKGAADGIRALETLHSRLPDIEVRLCGTVRPSEIPPWARFEFHPSDTTLRRLYSSSTVFLYPSRYEGFGLPPLEAMACGCPVVTTDVGAVPEFAANGRNALVVKAGDVEGMADAVETLLLNPTMREELSRCGLDTVQGYALNNNASLFRDALQRALNND